MDPHKKSIKDDFGVSMMLKKNFFDLIKSPLKIDDNVIEYEGKRILTNEITDFKCGMLEFNLEINEYPLIRIYRTQVRDKHNQIIKFSFVWINGIKSKEVLKLSELVQDSIWKVTVPTLVKKFWEELSAGKSVKIGNVVLTPYGIRLTTGILGWKKERLIFWKDVSIFQLSGYAYIHSTSDKTFKKSIDLSNTWNAIVILELINTMKEKGWMSKLVKQYGKDRLELN